MLASFGLFLLVQFTFHAWQEFVDWWRESPTISDREIAHTGKAPTVFRLFGVGRPNRDGEQNKNPGDVEVSIT
jgi:hypothetical protein